MKIRPSDISKALPPDARRLLLEAAAVDPCARRCESEQRTRAIDFAIGQVIRRYPRFFQEEA